MNAINDTQNSKPGLLRRATRFVVRVTVTLGVAAAAVFAIQMGSEELTRRADAAPSPDAAPLIPVETAPITIVPGYEVTRSFLGQVEPQRTAAVSFELSGRLNDILVDEGETVTEGQHIATLDTRLLDAEKTRLDATQAALEAQLRFSRQTVGRLSQLSDRGFASQAALDEALSRTDELVSRIAEVSAALLTNEIQAEKSRVFAPFAGLVTERFVDGGESVSPGQSLIEVVENGRPHLRVGVPLDIAQQRLNDVRVEIGGTDYTAGLIALLPDVDPVTRTRTALFEVNTDADLTFGQTARLMLTDIEETPGLWVPVTTLREGLRGQWTLFAVDDQNTVRALTVQVMHADGDQVFVRGAFPEDVALITSGPQRVTVGQAVDPQPAS